MSNSGTHGLDLLPDGDDFVLAVTDITGNVTQVKLTADQVLILSQSAPLFRERILSRRHLAAGKIEAVLATPVAQVGLNTDSLDEDILLTMIAGNGARQVYVLPEHIAQHLVEGLPKWIAKLQKKSTKQ